VIYGKQEGALGTCALSAPTGPSAFNIGGNTWHSAFNRGAEKSFLTTHDDAKNVERMRSKFKGLQLLILDEIRMIGARKHDCGNYNAVCICFDMCTTTGLHDYDCCRCGDCGGGDSDGGRKDKNGHAVSPACLRCAMSAVSSINPAQSKLPCAMGCWCHRCISHSTMHES
jgi:hypothetical protein